MLAMMDFRIGVGLCNESWKWLKANGDDASTSEKKMIEWLGFKRRKEKKEGRMCKRGDID